MSISTIPISLEDEEDGTFHVPHFQPPTVDSLNGEFSQYDLSELFSTGVTGALYRGHQPNLDRDICLKVLPPMEGQDGEAHAQAFLHEAKTMASLNHPNIVKVHDFGQTESGLLYFVMEYIKGSILRREMRDGDLTLEHVYAWVPPVCEALQYAHLQGVVHCDVRPANILISSDGRVKVANFGMARVEGQRPELSDDVISEYTAPETHLPGVAVDYRADIYSLGVMLYEMLTGQLPGVDYWKTSEIAGVDPRFDNVIHGALHADRELRFQTALDISGWVQVIEES